MNVALTFLFVSFVCVELSTRESHYICFSATGLLSAQHCGWDLLEGCTWSVLVHFLCCVIWSPVDGHLDCFQPCCCPRAWMSRLPTWGEMPVLAGQPSACLIPARLFSGYPANSHPTDAGKWLLAALRSCQCAVVDSVCFLQFCHSGGYVIVSVALHWISLSTN